MKQITIANQTVPVIGVGTWNMGEIAALHDQEVQAIKTYLQARCQTDRYSRNVWQWQIRTISA
ncbi:hypothetical protein WDC_1170 [Paucilactobacillus wasatchensis]|uniref:Aldo/keto reductase n=1 Tax=Paucilactobacillus wasatchensis TaxID=1335616 RepID=A0A0D1A6D5_9LACO|nr:hypothetical protein WDC_1170 [Paucilactobacillus wasatchensis]